MSIDNSVGAGEASGARTGSDGVAGRWTIHMRGWGHLVTSAPGEHAVPGSWPVVPCDDEAVQRAEFAVADAHAGKRPPSFRALALAALRAAGEADDMCPNTGTRCGFASNCGALGYCKRRPNPSSNGTPPHAAVDVSEEEKAT